MIDILTHLVTYDKYFSAFAKGSEEGGGAGRQITHSLHYQDMSLCLRLFSRQIASLANMSQKKATCTAHTVSLRRSRL